MNTEEKLKEFILSKYKSIREFTKEIEIPYSTVDNMLKKGISGTGMNTIWKTLNDFFTVYNVVIVPEPSGILFICYTSNYFFSIPIVLRFQPYV